MARAICLVLIFATGAPLAAQRTEPPVSMESLRAALQQQSPQPSILIPTYPWVAPKTTRLGPLTLMPPDTRGEMIKVMVPVGDLVSRAARNMSNARRRSAERRAKETVSRELRDFLAQQSK